MRVRVHILHQPAPAVPQRASGSLLRRLALLAICLLAACALSGCDNSDLPKTVQNYIEWQNEQEADCALWIDGFYTGKSTTSSAYVNMLVFVKDEIKGTTFTENTYVAYAAFAFTDGTTGEDYYPNRDQVPSAEDTVTVDGETKTVEFVEIMSVFIRKKYAKSDYMKTDLTEDAPWYWYDARVSTAPATIIQGNVSEVRFMAHVRPQSMRTWFFNFQKLTTITDDTNHGPHLHLDGVTSLRSTFMNCTSLVEYDMRQHDGTTSSLQTARTVFQNCTKLERLNLSNLDTRSVTQKTANDNYNCNLGFSTCTALTDITLGDNFKQMNTTTTEYLAVFPYASSSAKIWVREASYDGEPATLRKFTSNAYNSANSKFGIPIPDGTGHYYVDNSAPREYVVYCSAQKVLVFGVGSSVPAVNSTIDVKGYSNPLTVTAQVTTASNNEYADFCTKSTSYSSSSRPPWYIAYHTTATTVVFNNPIAPCSIAYWFYNFTALTKVVGIDNLLLDRCTTAANVFQATKISTIDLSGKNAPKLDDASSMFINCTSLQSADLSGMTLPALTTMRSMFYGCSSLQSVDLKSAAFPNVTTMQTMFRDCKLLQSVDFSNMTLPALETMESMFSGCSSLAFASLNNFKSPLATSTYSMFFGCSSLAYCDLEGFDTSSVTNMAGMFQGCSAITWANMPGIASFNVEKVQLFYDEANTRSMFYNCTNLEQADLSAWNLSSAVSMRCMFFGCSSLVSVDMHGVKADKVTTVRAMFSGCSKLAYVNIKDASFQALESMQNMFYECVALQSVDLKLASFPNVTTANQMFYNCTSLQAVDLSNMTLPKLETMSYMFYNCTSLQSADFSGMTLSKLETMLNMFFGCSALESANLSNLQTNGTLSDVGYLFCDCKNLKYCNLTSFDTSGVTTVFRMFRNCRAITWSGLEGIESLNMAKVQKFGNHSYFEEGNTSITESTLRNQTYSMGMFSGCTSLDKADLSQWDFSSAQITFGMFSGCTSLAEVALPNTMDSVNDMREMFNGCTNLTAVDCLTGRNMPALVYIRDMFYGCTSLTTVDFSGLHAPKLAYMHGLFKGCTALQTVDFRAMDTSANTTSLTATELFKDITSLRQVYLAGWNNHGKLTTLENWFSGCTNLMTCDMTGFDTSGVSDMKQTFRGCTQLNGSGLVGIDTLDVSNVMYFGGVGYSDPSNWPVSNQTNSVYYGTFYGCTSLTSLDLSDWDLSSATNAASMFMWCTNLGDVQLPASAPNLTNASLMFAKSGVTNLDLALFDVPKVQDARYICYGCDKLTSVSWWQNATAVTSLLKAFQSCTSLASFTMATKSMPELTSMEQMFSNCTKLRTVDFSDMDTSSSAGVLSISDMFLSATEIMTVNFSGWNNNGKITDLSKLFESNTDLALCDLTDFDTSGVTTMASMFSNCTSLTVSGLKGLKTLDVSKVASFESMFRGDVALNDEIELSSWDLSSATTMNQMFSGCTSLTKATIAGNAPSLLYLSQMFDGCTNLRQVDVSGLNASGVTQTTNFLRGCSSLIYLSVGSTWGAATASGYQACFASNYWYVYDKAAGTVLDTQHYYKNDDIVPIGTAATYIRNYSTSGASSTGAWAIYSASDGSLTFLTPQTYLDGGYTKTVTAVFTGFDTQQYTDSTDTTSTSCVPWYGYRASIRSVYVIDAGVNPKYMDYWFRNCTALTSGGIEQLERLNLGGVTSMSNLFSGCLGFSGDIDLRAWDVSAVQNMSYMLDGCSNLTSVNLRSWKTGALTDVSYFFNGCTNLQSLNASGWAAPNVQTAAYMFGDCSQLPLVDLSSWTCESLTNVSNMFHNCANLVSPGVERWNTSAIMNARSMFYGCTSLESIDLSQWDLSSLVNAGWMFSGCTKLLKADLSGWNTVSTLSLYNLFYMCAKLHYVRVPANFGKNVGVDTAYSAETDTAPRFPMVSGSYWYEYDDDAESIALQYTAASGGAIPQNKAVAKSYVRRGEPASTAVGGYAVWCADDQSLTFLSPQALLDEGLYTKRITNVYSGFDVESYAQSSVPWADVCGSIRTVEVLNEGNTHVPVVSTNNWFYQANNLVSVTGLSRLDTSGLKSMSYMFFQCTALQEVDLAGVDTSHVTDWSCAFKGCSLLRELDLEDQSFATAAAMQDMLSDCSSLVRITVGGGFMQPTVDENKAYFPEGTWNEQDTGQPVQSEGESMAIPVDQGVIHAYVRGTVVLCAVWCEGDASLNLTYAVTKPQVGDTYGGNAQTISAVYLFDRSGKDDGAGGVVPYTSAADQPWSSVAARVETVRIDSKIKPTAVAYWFAGFTRLANVEGLQRLDTSDALTFEQMFYGCTALKQIDLTSLDTRAATGLGEMLGRCDALVQVLTGANFSQAAATSAGGGIAKLPVADGVRKWNQDDSDSWLAGGSTLPDGAHFYQLGFQVTEISVTAPATGIVCVVEPATGALTQVGTPSITNISDGQVSVIGWTTTQGDALFTGVDAVCTVSFHLGEADEDDEKATKVAVPTGKVLAEPATPTWTGHDFAGWYANNALTAAYDFSAKVTESMDLYAKWTESNDEARESADKAGDKYDSEDASPWWWMAVHTSDDADARVISVSSPKIYASDNAAEADPLEPDDSWTDSTWTLEKDQSLPLKVTEGWTDSTKTDWTPNTDYHVGTLAWSVAPTSCTVTFVTNGGPTADPQQLRYGDRVVMPSNYTQEASPSKTDIEGGIHAFSGWFTDEDLTKPYEFDEKGYGTKRLTGNVVLYAQWNEAHTVVFDPCGGATAAGFNTRQTVAFGQAVPKPEDPTQAGLVFKGWYADADYTVSWDFTTVITKNMTLYARWSATADVEFESNGGSLVATQSVEYGWYVAEPTEPTREGFLFVGWFTSNDFSERYRFGREVTTDLVLYAKWDKMHTVTFNPQGGDWGTNEDGETIAFVSQQVRDRFSAVRPADPSNGGRAFLGWYLDDSYTAPYDFEDSITADTVLYARWAIYHTVTWMNYDGETQLAASNMVLDGSTPTYPDKTAPSRASTDTEVYAFSGWSAEVGGEKLEALPPCTGDVTYYAYFTAGTRYYTITFRNGFTTLQTVMAAYQVMPEYTGDTPTRATTAQYTYIWDGWSTANGGTLVYDTSTNLPAATANQTYYAHFAATKRLYAVTFNANGGTGGPSVQQVEYGRPATEPSYTEWPSRDDYAFAGWYTTAACTTAYSFNTAITAPTTIYARWAKATSAVSFDLNYPSAPVGPDAQMVAYGSKVSKPEDPLRDKYKFEGWYTDEGCTKAWDFDYAAVLDNMTLYAKWARSYEYMWYDEDGQTLLAKTQEGEGTTPAGPSDRPTKASTEQYSYAFDGWTEEVGGTVAALPKVSESSVKVYYAHYASSLRKYKVTFNSNGGTSVAARTVAYGGTVTKPTEPKRTGYTFAGWYNDQELTVLHDFAAFVTGAATVYAKWTINTYAITFANDDDTVLEQVSANYGARPVYTGSTPQKDPTIELTYVFRGWSAGTAAVYTASTLPTARANTTYKAIYTTTVRIYPINFRYSGADHVQNVAYGSTPTIPTDVGDYQDDEYFYVFTGWDKTVGAVSGTSAEEATAMYTAQYTTVSKNATFTVTYNGGSGTANDSETTHPRSDYAVKTVSGAGANGEYLAGWATTEGGPVVYRAGDTITVMCNMTLYAVYEVPEATLTLSQYTVGTFTYIRAVATNGLGSLAASEVGLVYGTVLGGAADGKFGSEDMVKGSTNAYVDESFSSGEGVKASEYLLRVVGTTNKEKGFTARAYVLFVDGNGARYVVYSAVLTKSYNDLSSAENTGGGGGSIIQLQALTLVTKVDGVPEESLIDVTDGATTAGGFCVVVRVDEVTLLGTYNATGPTVRYVEHGKQLAGIASPKREGYVFTGWFLDPAHTLPFDMALPVMSDLVLYADWEVDDASIEAVNILARQVLEAQEQTEDEIPAESGHDEAAFTEVFEYEKDTAFDVILSEEGIAFDDASESTLTDEALDEDLPDSATPDDVADFAQSTEEPTLMGVFYEPTTISRTGHPI